jgi:hypothetical protein
VSSNVLEADTAEPPGFAELTPSPAKSKKSPPGEAGAANINISIASVAAGHLPLILVCL